MPKSATAPLLEDQHIPSPHTNPADAGATTEALATTTGAGDMVLMFERLASNKDVDVEKLQRLIDMQKDIIRHNAEAAFNAAFAEMQADIPTIIEKGVTDKGKYATFEDIVEGVRPVLQRHGFSISFKTEWPEKTVVKVTGILTHREGHSRTSEFMASADASGSKNAIQGYGSSVSYGRRYTTRDLLNIASRGEDDDGEASGRTGSPEGPAGYAEWIERLQDVAMTGLPALTKAFNEGKSELRNHLTRHEANRWRALKKGAEQVGR